jgi:hypothetical protein
VLNRQEAQEARDEQRHAEIEYIQDQLGNRQLTEVGYGERLGIVMGVFGQQIQGLISNIRWPGWGPIAKALLDPRSYLMGVVSGLNMILTGASNVFSLEQWQRDPVGNLLKSAASIATGLTVILGTITALAGVIAAVMGALILITFGGAAPFALPIISFCTTVITTVGGWTLAVGKIALVLQALSLIKNLIDVGTARTADDLQRESEEIASDLGGAATVVLSIAGARGAQAGLQSTRNSVAGVLRAARRAGGGRALARATARAAPGAARRLGARLSRRGRVALGRLAGGGRRGAAAALGLAGGAGRLGLRFGLPIAFGALAAQGDLPMEGGPGTAGSTEEETPEDEGPSDISVEGAWVDVTPPEEASPGANVVSRYPIQRIKNWERYENTVAARLRTGRISGIPQMDHVISGVYGASGHGVDFFGLRVRGNRIYVYHIEVKSGRNPRLGRVFGGTRTQTGADWTDNAIERFLRDPVASRRLQRVLRMHGRPTDEASMRRLLRQGLRSSGRSFVVVRGWLLRRIRRQLGGIKRHRGTRAPRLRRFRFRF